jgi:hypothetical protein
MEIRLSNVFFKVQGDNAVHIVVIAWDDSALMLDAMLRRIGQEATQRSHRLRICAKNPLTSAKDMLAISLAEVDGL